VYKNIHIIERDVKRLNDEEMLNDNIIDFYLSHLEETYGDEMNDYYIFKTSFWPVMTGSVERSAQRIPTLDKKLFEKKYIIIPINEQ
jgi:sentrin-specific protease 7